MDYEFENFVNPTEKGFDTVVVQLGSHSIKFGYASQFQPFVVPNCIAYKLKDGSSENLNTWAISSTSLIESEIGRAEDEISKELSKFEKLNNFNKKGAKPKEQNHDTPSQQTLPEKKILELGQNATTNFKKAFAITNDINEDIHDNNFRWSESSKVFPYYLIGREAQSISDEQNYEIRYPIRYGYFNNEYAPGIVLNDLEKILGFCFFQILKLSKCKSTASATNIDDKSENQGDKPGFFSQTINDCNLVLAIPDVFIKQQVKMLINMFFRRFQFKSIITHTEGALTSFGSALTLGCIVDIGATKTTVCCIDEGFTIRESILQRNFGGDDVTHLFYHVLNYTVKKRSLPKLELNISSIYHKRIVEKLKEEYCLCPSVDPTIGVGAAKGSLIKAWIHSRGFDTQVINIPTIEEGHISSMLYFNTRLFKLLKYQSAPQLSEFNDIFNIRYSDPEDVMEELIDGVVNDKKEEAGLAVPQIHAPVNNGQASIHQINLTPKVKQHSNVKNYSSAKGYEDKSEQAVEPQTLQNDFSKHLLTFEDLNNYDEMFNYMAVDEMITRSIMSVHNPELRKKLANSIVLTGAASKLPNLISYLEDKLINKLTENDAQIERVEIINLPNFDGKTLTWIGASIVPKLESSKEMWISKEKWFCDMTSANSWNETTAPIQKAPPQNELPDFDDELFLNENKKDGKTNEKSKATIKRKRDKMIEAGVSLLRQKTPYIWSKAYN